MSEVSCVQQTTVQPCLHGCAVFTGLSGTYSVSSDVHAITVMIGSVHTHTYTAQFRHVLKPSYDWQCTHSVPHTHILLSLGMYCSYVGS